MRVEGREEEKDARIEGYVSLLLAMTERMMFIKTGLKKHTKRMVACVTLPVLT